MRFLVDGTPVEVDDGASLLIQLLRHSVHPTGGGCLCLAGDCPHCLVELDGVGYVRSCQVGPRDGMRVALRHRDGGVPPLVGETPPSEGVASVPESRHVHCDVVVVGQGPAGRAAAESARAEGKSVEVVEARDGREAVGIYLGPLVVARTATGKLELHPRDEIVVATGAAEIQPVVPGSDLEGLVTARAATRLVGEGIDLGRVVSIGRPPEGIAATEAHGDLVRFEGEGRIRAVVVRGEHGSERRHPCDTVSVGLGLVPRDLLARMGRGLPIRVVGDACRTADMPPCPATGTVCPCAGVTVGDLESVWERGFRRVELVKRATLAGTGTCQGSTCTPYVRSFLVGRGQALEPPFTARPMARQLTLAEVAAGAHHRATPRTPLHDEHLALGAQMDRTGGWWRPWSYGDAEREYRAVREAVSLGDVSPLGKFRLSGPDASALLEHLYPTRLAGLGIGRSRYALLLDERGYVLDDGLVCRDADERYTLTLTSAGASFGELWLRDWIDAGRFDVRLLNQTFSLGAINVTGPRAAELLARAGAEELPAFAAHLETDVAGVRCRIYRLSFTGELSYELHHAAIESAGLWRRLLELGRDLGIYPHGMRSLLDLRLEKGHIVVGKDTDFDSTPRRIDHEWAVKLEKEEFVGRQAVSRTGRRPLDRQLVGLEMEPPAPIEGAVIWNGEDYAGYVTSSALSHQLGKAVMLGWVRLTDGELPSELTIAGRPARRVPVPFYDSDGSRARAPIDFERLRSEVPAADASDPPPEREVSERTPWQRLEAIRVAASPAALDAAEWAGDPTVLRLAPDEALALTDRPPALLTDPHALVERETGFVAARLGGRELERLVASACSWELPTHRPAQAQGALAEIPVAFWLEDDRAFLVVRAAWATDLERRLKRRLGGGR